MNHCSCGFDIGDPRVSRHSSTCAAKRIRELEGTIGLERIDTHELRDRISELESARKDWEHQKWLLEMELEGYKELCKAQEFIINELKVAE